ncbi:CCN family member 4 [Schistocerca americana]|uniref:CCN family member 4 n=1 Tax=Schistocerca americana TaxID=7009 RepID=UPI001F5007D0|nr:CCN family member 4 [Schistocerca americana]XP_049946407.1 CCN family member 4 [Schistocerca serialis cubense]
MNVAVLLVLSLTPELEGALGQRAPCYECEVYKDQHPQSRPYQEIRSHCSYPCECGPRPPSCPAGVSLVRDGCGCCAVCARQQGDACDGTALCDERRGLVCQYPHRTASTGVCQAIKGLPCTVYNRTYDNGETFLLDCRTQCACQNGTYACASLCPQESISPQGACHHPRLVEVPGQCCREWLCDSDQAERPPDCRPQQFSRWSECSARCGLGESRRASTLSPQCRPSNETRLCQQRPCAPAPMPPPLPPRTHHHIRRGHECKATLRSRSAVRLRVGPCRSRRRFRPRACAGGGWGGAGGGCAGRRCRPLLSTTLHVDFRCPLELGAEPPGVPVAAAVMALVRPGDDLWADDDHEADEEANEAEEGGFGAPQDTITLPVQWILKCVCTPLSESEPADAEGAGGGGGGEVLLHRVHRTAAP